MYTVPAIVDPKTGAALAESATIARYLDATYPDTPRAFPEGTDAFHAALEDALMPTVFQHIIPLIMPLIPNLLSPENAQYYRAARASQLGAKLDELSPPGSEVRKQQWAAFEAGMSKVAKWLDAGGKEGRFFMGERISFADFVLGAGLLCMKKALGEDNEEWKAVAGWHGGRWARYVAALEEYAV